MNLSVLSSINFKQADALRGIQFVFSDGQTSPMFETVEGNNLQMKVSQLDTSKIARKVSVYVAPESEFMWGIEILDAQK